MSTLNTKFSAGRPLRILIVDDNHINLSILSTLLKRRFGPLLDGSPVTVDSGLKAIQLLRSNIFDCILMDIQMPFLSGLEATRRIRNAEDGILSANRDTHIIAVTTAVGDEPELAYRKAKMDGIIGKPVRFQHLQEYLCPLAHEAMMMSQSVSPVFIDGYPTMPPLPQRTQQARTFFMPTGAQPKSSSRPDICDHSNFEQLLEAETKLSLRRCSTATANRASRLHDSAQKSSSESTLTTTHHMSDKLMSPLTVGAQQQSTTSELVQEAKFCSPLKGHSRLGSMTISRRTLCKQIAREASNAGVQADAAECSGSESDNCVVKELEPRPRQKGYSRPSMLHRISSPQWLADDEELVGKGQQSPRRTTPVRPTLSMVSVQGERSSSSSGSNGDSSELFSPPLRRGSQASSTGSASDGSSAVTTPNCDEEASYHLPSQVRKSNHFSDRQSDDDNSLALRHRDTDVKDNSSDGLLSSFGAMQIRTVPGSRR